MHRLIGPLLCLLTQKSLATPIESSSGFDSLLSLADEQSLESPLKKRTDDDGRQPINLAGHDTTPPAPSDMPFALWTDESPKPGDAAYIAPEIPVSRYWGNDRRFGPIAEGYMVSDLYEKTYKDIDHPYGIDHALSRRGVITTTAPHTDWPCIYIMYWKLTVSEGFKWGVSLRGRALSSLNELQSSPLDTRVIRDGEQDKGYYPGDMKSKILPRMQYWLKGRLNRTGKFDSDTAEQRADRPEAYKLRNDQDCKWQDPLYMGTLQLLVGQDPMRQDSGVNLTYRLLDITDRQHPVEEIEDGWVWDQLPDNFKRERRQQHHTLSEVQVDMLFNAVNAKKIRGVYRTVMSSISGATSSGWSGSSESSNSQDPALLDGLSSSSKSSKSQEPAPSDGSLSKKLEGVEAYQPRMSDLLQEIKDLEKEQRPRTESTDKAITDMKEELLEIGSAAIRDSDGKTDDADPKLPNNGMSHSGGSNSEQLREPVLLREHNIDKGLTPEEVKSNTNRWLSAPQEREVGDEKAQPSNTDWHVVDKEEAQPGNTDSQLVDDGKAQPSNAAWHVLDEEEAQQSDDDPYQWPED